MDELYEKFLDVSRMLQRGHIRHYARRGYRIDPMNGQGRVLSLLRMKPEMTTRELCMMMGIRQQSLNELIGKLEAAGLVVRRPSPYDRRVMLIHLTEQGKAAQAPESLQEMPDVFACLTSEEKEQLNRLLDKVAAGMQDVEYAAEESRAYHHAMHHAMHYGKSYSMDAMERTMDCVSDAVEYAMNAAMGAPETGKATPTGGTVVKGAFSSEMDTWPQQEGGKDDSHGNGTA